MVEKVAGWSILWLEVLFREAPWPKWLEKLGYGGEGSGLVSSVIRDILQEAPWPKWFEKLGYGGEGNGLVNCFVRGVQNFFYLLCVCVWGGGGGVEGVRSSTSPSVKKITDPPPIN